MRHMKGSSILTAVPLLAIATAAAPGGEDCTGFPCGNNGNKVLVCHVPPDDPTNPHTICISPSAVPAHLANHPGDACGECIGGGGTVSYAGDVGGDKTVGVADLVELVTSWGSCADNSCPADLDADGAVGVPDLLIVLTNWD